MLRIALALLPLAAVAAASAAPAAAPLRDLAYAAEAREQTLDLYLPEAGAGKSPLVAFVHSRFWSRTDDARLIEWGVARPLQREGAAVTFPLQVDLVT